MDMTFMTTNQDNGVCGKASYVENQSQVVSPITYQIVRSNSNNQDEEMSIQIY